MSASVNLWELITCVAGRDLPRTTSCKAVEAAAGAGSFVNNQELSLDVSDNSWTIRVFPCEQGDEVVLSITRLGRVTVVRNRTREGITDTRSISF